MPDALYSRNGRDFFGDAIVVAIFTALGYVVTFFYESEYAAYFGIPMDLISISLSQVVRVAVVLIVSAFLIFMVVNGTSVLFPSVLKNEYIARRLSSDIPFALIILGLLVTYGRDLIQYRYFTFGVVLIYAGLRILDWIIPLIRRSSDTRPFLQRVQEYDQRNITISFSGLIAKRTGNSPFIILMCIVVVVLWAQALGHSSARKKTDFLVDQDTKQVVLAFYGNTVVLGSYNDSTNILGEELTVSVLGPGNPYHWRRESLKLTVPRELRSWTRPQFLFSPKSKRNITD